MGEIVKLRPMPRPKLSSRAPSSEPAKLLLYTGVRIERLTGERLDSEPLAPNFAPLPNGVPV